MLNNKVINQDGTDWNANFFRKLTEDQAVSLLIKTGHKQSTAVAVWKQANGKTKPNKKATKKEEDK